MVQRRSYRQTVIESDKSCNMKKLSIFNIDNKIIPTNKNLIRCQKNNHKNQFEYEIT